MSEYLVPENRRHKGTTVGCWESYIYGVSIIQAHVLVSIRKQTEFIIKMHKNVGLKYPRELDICDIIVYEYSHAFLIFVRVI